jgi:hypothetical protein
MLLLSAVVLFGCAACGQARSAAPGQRLLRRQQVEAAFARAGLRLFYIGHEPGTKVDDYNYFPKGIAGGGTATLEVAVLPAVKPAQEAFRLAGYRSDATASCARSP